MHPSIERGLTKICSTSILVACLSDSDEGAFMALSAGSQNLQHLDLDVRKNGSDEAAFKH